VKLLQVKLFYNSQINNILLVPTSEDINFPASFFRTLSIIFSRLFSLNSIDPLHYSILTSEFLERLVLGRVWRHHRVVRMLGVASDQVLACGVVQVAQAADGHQARDGG